MQHTCHITFEINATLPVFRPKSSSHKNALFNYDTHYPVHTRQRGRGRQARGGGRARQNYAALTPVRFARRVAILFGGTAKINGRRATLSRCYQNSKSRSADISRRYARHFAVPFVDKRAVTRVRYQFHGRAFIPRCYTRAFISRA